MKRKRLSIKSLKNRTYCTLGQDALSLYTCVIEKVEKSIKHRLIQEGKTKAQSEKLTKELIKHWKKNFNDMDVVVKDRAFSGLESDKSPNKRFKMSPDDEEEKKRKRDSNEEEERKKKAPVSVPIFLPSGKKANEGVGDAKKEGDKERESDGELCSDDDEDSGKEGNPEDSLVCQYSRVARTKDIFSLKLEAGVLHHDGKEYCFSCSRPGTVTW